MSRENVELVRSICSRWEAGDFDSAEWAHPDIEYEIADGPAPGRWTGLAGMAEGARSLLNAWQETRVEADDYRDLGGELVFVPTRYTGRGKTSGLEIGQMGGKGAFLFQLRDGKVTRHVVYLDRESALEAVGLGE